MTGEVETLDDRVVAIAGAGGSLGPGVAERLARTGARLGLTDVSQEALARVSESLALDDDRLDTQPVDLLDLDAARSWAASLIDRFGRVDAVMHLVGGFRGGEPIHEASLEDYEFLHAALVRTTQRVSQAFYSALSASEHGRFVLVSSSLAQAPSGTYAAYAATKAAAESWTLALADSFAAEGSAATANIIVVNAIGDDDPAHTPVDHIAETCAFLCSERAARMNGRRLALHP